jgi:hypothetical protein
MVGNKTSLTCVYTRRERLWPWRKSVVAELIGRLATSVELPHGPINTPYRWKSTHTPHFRDSTCKVLFFCAIARHILVGRVARLWGPEGLLACQEPPHSSSVETLLESFGGPTWFLSSSLLKRESSAGILWIPTESLYSSPSGVTGFRLIGIPTTLPQSGWFANHGKLSNHFS